MGRLGFGNKLLVVGAVVLLIGVSTVWASQMFGTNPSTGISYGIDKAMISTSRDTRLFPATNAGLHSAIYYMNGTDGTVYLPVCHIDVTSNVSFDVSSHLRIQGVSTSSTILHCNNVNGVFYYKGTGASNWLELCDFQITGTGYDANLVTVVHGYMVDLEDMWVHNAGWNSGANSSSHAVYASDVDIMTMSHCLFNYCNNTAVVLDRRAGDTGVMVCTVSNCHFQYNYGGGLYHTRGVELRMDNSVIEGTYYGYGLYLNNTWSDVISNCYFEINDYGHVFMRGFSGGASHSNVISNCYFEGAGSPATDQAVTLCGYNGIAPGNTVISGCYFRYITPFSMNNTNLRGLIIRDCEFEREVTPIKIEGSSGFIIDNPVMVNASFNDEFIDLTNCNNSVICNVLTRNSFGTNTILLNNCHDMVVRDCVFQSVANTAIKLNMNCTDILIDSCVVNRAGGNSFYLEGAGNINRPNRIRFVNCVSNNSIGLGFVISSSNNVTIDGCSIISCDDDYGISLAGSNNVTISNCLFDGNDYYEVFVTTGNNVFLTNNLVLDSIPLHENPAGKQIYCVNNILNNVFNTTYFVMPGRNTTSSVIPSGFMWYSFSTHRLYVYEGAVGKWKYVTFT